MFLPILEASRVDRRPGADRPDRARLDRHDHLYTYRITRVRRHQKTLAWAFDLPPNFLVLQTSEDQYRTGAKVMVQAQPGRPGRCWHRARRPARRPDRASAVADPRQAAAARAPVAARETRPPPGCGASRSDPGGHACYARAP